MSIRMSKSLMIVALLTAGVVTSGSALAQAADGERSTPRAEKVAAMKERHAERMTERLDGCEKIHASSYLGLERDSSRTLEL